MKFLNIKIKGAERLGWLQEDEQTVLMVDPADPNMPQSILEIIRRGPYAINQLTSAQERLEKKDISELEILPPIVNPGAIFCVGLNYSDHAEELGLEKTQYPTIFLRMARNHVAFGQPLIKPTISDTLDWEGELVVVIGKGGRHISAEHAQAHIFGYSIYNEGSVREFQYQTAQYGMGKNFQASAAFGPLVVTADEFGNPYEHKIETHINGEQVQSASISLMLHKIEEVIAYLSSTTELQPGDIICTGTPSGTGAGMNPPRFLKDGDIVEVSISGIGALSNPVKDEPTDLNAVACSC